MDMSMVSGRDIHDLRARRVVAASSVVGTAAAIGKR